MVKKGVSINVSIYLEIFSRNWIECLIVTQFTMMTEALLGATNPQMDHSRKKQSATTVSPEAGKVYTVMCN